MCFAIMFCPCNVLACLHASVDKTLLCVLPVCSMYRCAAHFGCCEARSLPSDWVLAGISSQAVNGYQIVDLICLNSLTRCMLKCQDAYLCKVLVL